MKLLTTVFGLSLSFSASAGLPTDYEHEQLNLVNCNQSPSSFGSIGPKPLFAIKNSPAEFTLEKLDANEVQFEYSDGDDFKDVLISIFKSFKCVVLNDCEVDTRNNFYVDTFNMANTTPSNTINNSHSVLSNLQSIFADTNSRQASYTFPTRGITEATVLRTDEWQWDSTNSDESIGFTNHLTYCSSTFVYVQNRPTIGTLTSLSGFDFPTGVHKFTTSTATMDTYSRYPQQNKPIEYEWRATNRTVPSTITVITTSPSVSLNFAAGGEYTVSVRSFDGTHYSPMKRIFPYVEGSLCLGNECFELN